MNHSKEIVTPERVGFSLVAVANLFQQSQPVSSSIDGIRRSNPAGHSICHKASMVIDGGIKMSLEEGLKLELENLESVFMSEDCLEGLTSSGKKKPEFKGK